MKRRLAAWLLLPLALLMTGCMKMNVEIDVKDKDTAHMVFDMGIQKAFADIAGQSGSPMTPDSMCERSDIPSGSTREPYDDGTYIGCRVSGDAKIGETADGDSTILALKDNVWTFKMVADSSQTEELAGMTPAQVFTDFRVQITFPGEVLTHNGSSTLDERTVTWTNAGDLFSPSGLEATAKNGAGVPWLPILIGVGALLIVGGVVAFFLMRKKKPQGPGTAANMSGFPQQPGFGPQQGGYPQQGGFGPTFDPTGGQGGYPTGQPTPPPYGQSYPSGQPTPPAYGQDAWGQQGPMGPQGPQGQQPGQGWGQQPPYGG